MILKDEIRDKQNINLIIFDIDGTLVRYSNLELLVKEAFNNYKVSPTNEDLKGQSVAVIELLKRSQTEKIFSLIQMSQYWDKYMNLSDKGINPIDFTCEMLNLETKYLIEVYGVKETIYYLNEYKKLVCSTNWFLTSQRKKLLYAGISEKIEKVYTCEKEYSKPSELHFKRILNNQEILPNQAIMIGDSIDDLSSNKVGIQSILVDYNKTKEEIYSYASSVITNFTDLKKVLNK